MGSMVSSNGLNHRTITAPLKVLGGLGTGESNLREPQQDGWAAIQIARSMQATQFDSTFGGLVGNESGTTGSTMKPENTKVRTGRLSAPCRSRSWPQVVGRFSWAVLPGAS